MDTELQKSLIEAGGTIAAAIIVGLAGGVIGRRYTRERDKQDKESQWRDHAIELTKLDLERKLKTWSPDSLSNVRPSMLDFLANYRDLTELDTFKPAELYEKINTKRIQARQKNEPAASPTAVPDSVTTSPAPSAVIQATGAAPLTVPAESG